MSALEFKKRVVKEDYELMVYEAVIGDAVFAYLYVTPDTYSLAWIAPEDFSFTGKYPCDFIEYQFTDVAPHEIELRDEKVPFHELHGKMLQKKLFCYEKSVAYLIFADAAEEASDNVTADFEEYNFFSQEERDRYKETLESDAISHLLCARYDFEIVTYKKEGFDMPKPDGRYNCCFTLENRHGTSANGWECAFKLPRNLGLKERTLKWIAKNHRDKNFWVRMDFKESLAACKKNLSAYYEMLNR